MKLLELVENIKGDDRFKVFGAKLGQDPVDDEMVVLSHVTKAAFAIKTHNMTEATWEDYIDMFLGRRYPDVMTWVTRIIGYYSFVKSGAQGISWNLSKISELADRQKGNYDILDSKVVSVNPEQLPITFSTSHVKPVSEAEWKRRLREKGIIEDAA